MCVMIRCLLVVQLVLYQVVGILSPQHSLSALILRLLKKFDLIFFLIDNEIDGTGFFDLTESDVKSMVSKLGIVKKICRLQTSVRY